jgi:hypothetical protein
MPLVLLCAHRSQLQVGIGSPERRRLWRIGRGGWHRRPPLPDLLLSWPDRDAAGWGWWRRRSPRASLSVDDHCVVVAPRLLLGSPHCHRHGPRRSARRWGRWSARRPRGYRNGGRPAWRRPGGGRGPPCISAGIAPRSAGGWARLMRYGRSEGCKKGGSISRNCLSCLVGSAVVVVAVVTVVPVRRCRDRHRGLVRPSPVCWIGSAFRWGRPRPRRVVAEAVGSSRIRRHLALRAAAAARPAAVWSPVAVSQGPAAVLVAWGLLTTKVRRPDHHLGVGLLTTKVPRLGVVRLGLGLGLAVAVDLLCLGLAAVARACCLGLVVVVASRPSRVRRWVAAVALGLAACRRRRGAPRVGT